VCALQHGWDLMYGTAQRNAIVPAIESSWWFVGRRRG
jgi:hypothetical protein